MPWDSRRGYAIAALLLAFCLLDCHDSSGPEAVAGTYTLRTVDGHGPPFWLYYSQDAFPIDGRLLYAELTFEGLSASLRLEEDGTCSHTTGERVTEVRYDALTLERLSSTVDTVYVTNDACTYGFDGRSVAITYAGGAALIGSISGDMLMLVTGGGTWVYER